MYSPFLNLIMLIINKNLPSGLQSCYDRTTGVLSRDLHHNFLYHFHRILPELYAVCCISQTQFIIPLQNGRHLLSLLLYYRPALLEISLHLSYCPTFPEFPFISLPLCLLQTPLPCVDIVVLRVIYHLL